jgi:secreted Zn-dependent insulinase-like peptidase
MSSPSPEGLGKSPRDKRNHCVMTLPNGIEVVLTEDLEAERAVIVAIFPVGSGDDPKNDQGRAHAVEHCISSGVRECELRSKCSILHVSLD